jgi:hypothetical protein
MRFSGTMKAEKLTKILKNLTQMLNDRECQQKL